MALLLGIILLTASLSVDANLKIHFKDTVANKRYVLFFYTKYQDYTTSTSEEERALKDHSMRFINIDDLDVFQQLHQITTEWCLKDVPARGKDKSEELSGAQITSKFRVNPFVIDPHGGAGHCLPLSIDANTAWKKLEGIRTFEQLTHVEQTQHINLHMQHYGVLRPNPHVGIHSELYGQRNQFNKVPLHVNQQWWTPQSAPEVTPSGKFVEIFWQSQEETRVIGIQPLPDGFYWQLVPGTRMNEGDFEVYLPVLMDTQRVSAQLTKNPDLTHLHFMQNFGYEEWIRALRKQAGEPKPGSQDSGSSSGTQYAKRIQTDVGALTVALENECPICLEQLNDKDSGKLSLIKTCGHMLHQQCMQGVINSGSGACPVCRKPFGPGDVEEITADSMKSKINQAQKAASSVTHNTEFVSVSRETDEVKIIPEDVESQAHATLQQTARQQHPEYVEPQQHTQHTQHTQDTAPLYVYHGYRNINEAWEDWDDRRRQYYGHANRDDIDTTTNTNIRTLVRPSYVDENGNPVLH